MNLSPDIIPELSKASGVSQNKAYIPGKDKAEDKAKAEVDKPCIYQPQMECRPGEIDLCEKCPELAGKCGTSMLKNLFGKIKGLAIDLLNRERYLPNR